MTLVSKADSQKPVGPCSFGGHSPPSPFSPSCSIPNSRRPSHSLSEQSSNRAFLKVYCSLAIQKDS